MSDLQLFFSSEPERIFLRNIVNTALAERIAPQNPKSCQQRTTDNSETLYCLNRILRTGGIKPAGRRQKRWN